jgi:membrane protease YdiL (CAAX protease family)
MTTDSERSPDESQPPVAPGPVLPAEKVFLETTELAARLEPPSPRPAVQRPPGPGFWESMAWIIGLQVVQFVGLLIASVFLIVWSLVSAGATNGAGSGQALDGAALMRAFSSIFREEFILIIGMTQLAGAGYALLAVHLRLRPRGLARLGWQPPHAGHMLLVVAGMLPLAALSSQVQNEVFKLFPWSQEQMAELMGSLSLAPLWMVVLIIGAGPAVGEELLFRGLIGRGLVARYGVVLGIAVTSVLFGVMHLNPAQGTGAIMLGIAMHFVYVTTRSFWAPMTLHFLNNTFSVILVKLGGRFGVKEFAADYSDSLPGALLFASTCLVATIGLLLWQTRVRYVTSDGTAWDPGYPTAEVPPAEVGARPVSQPPKQGLVVATAFCALGFAAAVWKMVATG